MTGFDLLGKTDTVSRSLDIFWFTRLRSPEVNIWLLSVFSPLAINPHTDVCFSQHGKISVLEHTIYK